MENGFLVLLWLISATEGTGTVWRSTQREEYLQFQSLAYLRILTPCILFITTAEWLMSVTLDWFLMDQ